MTGIFCWLSWKVDWRPPIPTEAWLKPPGNKGLFLGRNFENKNGAQLSSDAVA
jgi:hypothetical protein